MSSSHILLIDDHPMFGTGLCLVLNRAMPNAGIFQAASVDEALNTTANNTVSCYMQEILKYFEIATRTEAVFAARQQALEG